MNLENLKGLKSYLLAYALVVIGFFTYSGMIGWKWFNPTKTEKERSGGHHTTGGRYLRYHK